MNSKTRPSRSHEFLVSSVKTKTVGTDTSAEDEGQSEWSIKECQELLGEVTTEKTRVHRSVEESGEPLLDVVMEICSRDTASIDLLTKETPGMKWWLQMMIMPD